MISTTKIKLHDNSRMIMVNTSYLSTELGNFFTLRGSAAAIAGNASASCECLHTCRESLQVYMCNPSYTYDKSFIGLALAKAKVAGDFSGVEAMAQELEQRLGEKARLTIYPTTSDHCRVVGFGPFFTEKYVQIGFLSALLRLGMIHWHGSIQDSIPHYPLIKAHQAVFMHWLAGNTKPTFDIAEPIRTNGLIRLLDYKLDLGWTKEQLLVNPDAPASPAPEKIDPPVKTIRPKKRKAVAAAE